MELLLSLNPSSSPGWRNWQTRNVQSVVGETPSGFKSPPRHFFDMRTDLNIHGVKVRLSADHPLIFRTLLADLAAFRSSPSNDKQTIHLKISALAPFLRDGETDRETAMQSAGKEGLVTRHMTTDITVLTHPQKREIRAAVVPEPSLLPDPAYHYLFTQPLNLWFKRKGLFFLHAGCVADRSRGVLLIGHPRAGKSTLSLSAVRAGFKFLSDEQPLLGLRGGKVLAHCFPRRIRLGRPSAARFPELRRLLGRSGKRLIFSMESIRPGSLQSSSPVSLLIFPRFKKQGALQLRRLQPAAALAQLLEDDHFVWYRNKPLDRISQRHLDLFQKLVLQAPAYRLEYNDRDISKIPARLNQLLDKNR